MSSLSHTHTHTHIFSSHFSFYFLCTALHRAEGQDVPRRAPAWWGCPRGPRCEFAHGEEELRGDSREHFEQQKKAEKRDVERQKKDIYMGAVESNQSSEEMESMVAAGLGRLKKKNKKNKKSESSEEATWTETGTESGTEALTSSSSLSSSSSSLGAPQERAASDEEKKEEVEVELKEEDLLPPVWLHSATSSSTSSSLVVHPGGVVECTQGFGTALVRQQQHVEEKEGEKEEEGRWQGYYEVELITGGLMQVGGGRQIDR